LRNRSGDINGPPPGTRSRKRRRQRLYRASLSGTRLECVRDLRGGSQWPQKTSPAE
jgi:hypothetical protein